MEITTGAHPEHLSSVGDNLNDMLDLVAYIDVNLPADDGVRRAVQIAMRYLRVARDAADRDLTYERSVRNVHVRS